MIGTRQADPFYLESPSGEIYTSPFFLAFASVPSTLPQPEKSPIGEKSSSGHLIGARWYDPELGLWMSPDPLEQYPNPYSYVGGNTPNLTDPDGLASSGDICPDCISEPDRNVRNKCIDQPDHPDCQKTSPYDGDPVLTAVAIAGGLVVISAVGTYELWGDDFSDWFSGGGKKRKESAPSGPPVINQNPIPTQPIALPNYGGYSLAPNLAGSFYYGGEEDDNSSNGLALVQPLATVPVLTRAAPVIGPTTMGAAAPALLLRGSTGEDLGTKWHLTYTKPGPAGTVYSGRASGWGKTPLEVLSRYDQGHRYNFAGFGPARLDKAGLGWNYRAAIRGREQQLIDFYGGAIPDPTRHPNSISANMIRGISVRNPNYWLYDGASTLHFGRLPMHGAVLPVP